MEPNTTQPTPVSPNSEPSTPTPTPAPAEQTVDTPISATPEPVVAKPYEPEVVAKADNLDIDFGLPSEAEKLAEQEVSKPKTIEEKLKEAKLAMAGPERVAKEEKLEKAKEAKEEISKLEKEKARLDKEKETLEMAWIELDNKRNGFKESLAPILEQETKVEEQESLVEAEEDKSDLPEVKKGNEQKRQAIQAERAAIEKQKWDWQDKIAKVDAQIEENTKKYQAILDEEEKINTEIENFNAQLI